MHRQPGIPVFIILLALVLLPGCNKSDVRSGSDAVIPENPTPLHADTVARVYWMGKSRLGVDVSAYYPMRIWRLPAIRQLETRTLEKLSFLPLQRIGGNPALADSFARMMLPLVHDIVQSESYFELRCPPNQSEELVFAIRLEQAQAAGWATNFVVAGSLVGIPVNRVATGHDEWMFQTQAGVNRLTRIQVGGWAVLSSTTDANGSLLAETVARIKQQGSPFVPKEEKTWIQVDLDLPKITTATNLPGRAVPADQPRLFLAITGDGANVIARGELNFAAPIEMDLEPWVIPQSLIQQPLAGFTAIRGLNKSWLPSLFSNDNFPLQPLPKQVFFWAKEGSFESYFAIPSSDSGGQIGALTAWLAANGNPWISTNAAGSFQQSSTQKGAVWSGLPTIQPFIEPVAIGADQWMLGGIMPKEGLKPGAPPAELPLQVLAQTNLIYFDWEATGPRIESGVYISQILRVIFKQSQLPLESVAWLRELGPRLAICRTVVHQTGVNQDSFERKATVGLSAMELQLLADWLASPGFPKGLHTTLSPVALADPPRQ